MQLSHVLLLCTVVLTCTDAVGGYLALTHTRKFTLFYVAFVALLLDFFPIMIIPELTLSPGYFVLLVYAMYIPLDMHGALSWIVGAGMAAIIAFLMLIVMRMNEPPTELGLILSLIGAISGIVLMRFTSIAIMSACLAPLLLGFYLAFIDLHAYGYTVMTIGMDYALDAAVGGMMFSALLSYLFSYPLRVKS